MKKLLKINVPWQLKIVLSLTFAVAAGILRVLSKPLCWELEMCLCLFSALGACAALLCVPKKQLARIGRMPGLDPNWITFWGLIVWWLGLAYWFIANEPYFTTLLCGIGGTLDVIDGKTAVAMFEEGVWRSPLSKRIGKWLDPLCDKLKYPPVIVLFTFGGTIYLQITIWIVVTEIFGTLIRNPINIGARMAWSAKKMKRGWQSQTLSFIGRRMVRKSKASGFGKVKATIQSLGLLVCVPYYRRWYTDWPDIPSMVYSLALAFGIVSIISRMRIYPAFDRLIDKIGNAGSLFKHRDFKLAEVYALFGTR